ncbi:hypothetical protein BJ970_006352 [Saccharopolyspora phatthalungensis]|uniref:Uncharacterized protein n=1 Tax=Saccharopolyspora phatthalungensis TaxID=664693 RepID=A0A840QKB5_9PSEU|nr:hypothetical protein [Saccharopolyspora phatthalungensis]
MLTSANNLSTVGGDPVLYFSAELECSLNLRGGVLQARESLCDFRVVALCYHGVEGFGGLFQQALRFGKC